MDGVLLVDKPVGCTSHDVVSILRKTLKRRQIGHAGTLDPLASGLLVALIGQGTKLSDYLLNGDKVYEAVFQLGLTTNTQDIEGEVLSQSPVELSPERVAEVVEELTGQLCLPVPLFSAVKVKGQRLYKYALKDQSVEVPTREMDFKRVQLRDFAGEHVRVELACAKGGFVRAWGHELGQRLGCGAVVKELRRTGSAPYALEEAISIEALKELMAQPEGESWLRQTGAFRDLHENLADWGEVKASSSSERQLVNGQISRDLHAELLRCYGPAGSGAAGEVPGVKVISARDQRLLALLTRPHQEPFRIRRVFPRTEASR